MSQRILQAVAMLCIFSVGLWSADDPVVGTWNLNVAKSKFGLGPVLKNETIKVENSGGSFKATVDGVDAQGNKIHAELAWKEDGKEYPIKGLPWADTLTGKRVSERSAETTYKKDGKAVRTQKSVISPDGKTWTLTTTGKDAQERTAENVAVFQKQ